MVPQMLALLRSRPRARSRARAFLSPSCAAIERLEERTLLSSATLAILNGNFTGSYVGKITVDDNGTKTTSNVAATSFQMTINNGAITLTTPAGDGTGTVSLNRAIVATVNASYQSTAVPISVAGTITNVNATQTYATGAWSLSVNLGGGVTATGGGTWSAGAPQELSNFNGNYAGTYQGSVTENNNGTKTTTPITPGTFTALINNGAVTVSFPSSTGLTSQGGTIDVTGRINGSTTFVEDGVTVTVTSSGPASRGMQGVNGSGVWSFKANLPGGIFLTGSGTWTLESVLDIDGDYAGTVAGNVTVDDNGTTTNYPIPGSTVTDNTFNMTIFNGNVIVLINDVSGTGTGTADNTGHITGLASFLENQAPVTVVFSGSGAPTANGNVLNGIWSIPTTNIGGGLANITISGSGTWTASSI